MDLILLNWGGTAVSTLEFHDEGFACPKWQPHSCTGEGWHNNHHAFENSCRHGLRLGIYLSPRGNLKLSGLPDYLVLMNKSEMLFLGSGRT